jgi:hypothetical protein
MVFRATRCLIPFLALLMLPFTMQAQSAAKAAAEEVPALQMDVDFVLSLPDASGLEPQYQLPVADLGMPNAKALQRLVAGMSDNLLRFRVSADGQSLILEPQYMHQSDWKAVDWNAYLQEVAPRFKRHKELALKH